MCGICGISGIDDAPLIERMTATLAHRGPDGSGTAFFPRHNLGLGHTRLSIIDLSQNGRQPMSTANGLLHITFNGEIYNYRELKAALDSDLFRTSTDTEVILHLYEKHGIEAFKLLNGMFAFALYDVDKERLYLVRDNLGIKPLYYIARRGRLIFGSEIKAILASNLYSPEIDQQSLYDYFSFLYVPSPNTMFRDIHQVPPSHFLEYDLRSKQVTGIHRYTHVVSPLGVKNLEPLSLKATLHASVQRQMIADVSVGAFLSGGIDSNIIVGIASSHSTAPLKTFTMSFAGGELNYYDERVEADRIAKKFGTEHHEINVDISHPEDMLDLIDSFDQPFGNVTYYLIWLLSKYTRKYVKVVLSGVGGDELFGGYPRYRAVNAMKYLRFIPRPIARGASQVLSLFRDDYSNRKLHRIRTFFDGLDPDPVRQYLRWTYYLDDDSKRQLLNHMNGNVQSSHRILAYHLEHISLSPPYNDDGNRYSYLDLETFLPGNLLEYSDKMSMAHGLELRVPFLDPDVVESAFSISFKNKSNKQILRQTFHDLIPHENLNVQKKGFNIPLGHWMRTKFDKYFDELLPPHSSPDAAHRKSIFNYEYITYLRRLHNSGRHDYSYELFSILIFEVWYRKYIK